MVTFRRSILKTAVIAFAGGGLAACGGGGDSGAREPAVADTEDVRSTVKDFLRLDATDHRSAACKLLTTRAHAQVEALGGVPGRDSCEDSLDAVDSVALGPDTIDRMALTRRGDRALLVLADDEGRFGLRADGGRWRIDDLLSPELAESPRPSDAGLTDGSDEQQVRATYEAVLDAYRARNYARSCGLLSYGAEAQVILTAIVAQATAKGSTVEPHGLPCAKAVRRVERLGGLVPAGATPSGVTVEVDGDRATVRAAGREAAPFVHEEGRWLVAPSDQPVI